MEWSTEKCANCGSKIGKLETPYVWEEDNTVCESCYNRLLAMKLATTVPPLSAAEPTGKVGNRLHFGPYNLPATITMGVGSFGLLVLGISPLFNWVDIGRGGVTGISGDGKIILLQRWHALSPLQPP